MTRRVVITAERIHDISCGHRVHGHESKCALLHGHNYRVTFVCHVDTLDAVGRVIDFSDIKAKLCFWLEDHWDHKFLAWERDELIDRMFEALKASPVFPAGCFDLFKNSIVFVPFNPTAENMAKYLLEVVGPMQLARCPGVRLASVRVEETRKCSVNADLFREEA